MRKIRFTIMAAVMAGILIFSGCVKNEESEGVRELRMGQAALLQARATATVMEAEAEAAFRMAMAAWNEAHAKVQLAYARQQEIINELNEAQNEITIAKLQLELEVLQSTQEYEISVAVAKAKELLNAAEISLMASIRALEKATAENDNALLKEYLDLYKNAMAEVLSVRGDIINESAKLARYQIYVDGYDCGDLVAEKLREQEKLENEVALMEIYKAKLEEVIGDPSLSNEELAEANKELDVLNKQMGELDKQEVSLDQTYDKAWDAYMTAGIEYSDVSGIVNNHPGIIDDWTNNVGFGPNFISVETLELEVSGNFSSKATYENWIEGAEENIAGWQAEIADFQVTLANQQAVYDIHAAKLAELYADYLTKQATYETAEQAYQVAKANYEADDSAENATALIDAADDRDAAETARTNALIAHDSYELAYYNPALSAVVTTQDAIALREGWIANSEGQIAGWLAEHAIVIDYIAYLQAELDEAEAMFDDVRTAYFAAKDAEEAAWDALADLWDEKSLLSDEISYAQWYISVLENNNESQIKAMDNIIEDIAAAKADIADLDVTFASWESAIAAQQAKIAVLEAELAYWEAVANDYKVMFEGEMGDE